MLLCPFTRSGVNINPNNSVVRTRQDGSETNFDSLLFIPGGMLGDWIISSPNGSLLAWEMYYYPSLETEVRVANTSEIIPGSQGNFGSSAAGKGRIVFSTGRVRGISFSPDGSKIALAASKNGQEYDIYIVQADGSGTPVRLTTSGDNGMPDWSNDNRIAFESNLTGRNEIYVMNPDGSDLTQVTLNGGSAPTWSPDSRCIAFASSRTGDTNIWVISLRRTFQPLTLTKSVDKTSASPNDILTYTLTYKNTSNTTITNVNIIDNIPKYTTYEPNSASDWGKCSYGQQITWNIGTLRPCEEGFVTFQVKVNENTPNETTIKNNAKL